MLFIVTSAFSTAGALQFSGHVISRRAHTELVPKALFWEWRPIEHIAVGMKMFPLYHNIRTKTKSFVFTVVSTFCFFLFSEYCFLLVNVFTSSGSPLCTLTLFLSFTVRKRKTGSGSLTCTQTSCRHSSLTHVRLCVMRARSQRVTPGRGNFSNCSLLVNCNCVQLLC